MLRDDGGLTASPPLRDNLKVPGAVPPAAPGATLALLVATIEATP